MSEAEDTRPLTRRERRIKEFGETGALPLLNQDGTSRLTNPQHGDEEIHVDPLDENGNPRSRREIREIREKMRQQRAAQIVRDTEQHRTDQAEAEPQAQLPVVEVVEEIIADAAETEQSDSATAPASEDTNTHEVPTVFADEPQAEAADGDEVEASDNHAEAVTHTSANSFDELFLQDVSEPAARTFREIPVDAVAEAEADSVNADPATEVVESVTDETVVETEVAVSVAENIETLDIVKEEVVVEDAVAAETFEADLTEVFTEGDAEAEAHVGAANDSVTPEPVQAKRAGYTYPDIAPLDDEISVFDDPAVRTISGSSQAAPAFDDLISRAVAQEGASGSTNTSALILPSMPDTGSLAGPLGETGELFITGSIDLPRSFSETGGHASLIDSVDADHLEEFGAVGQHPQESGIVPVSATRAVSARVIPGPVVTEAQKEKSKLPVVLIATGGGLVVVVAGLLIWGATSGMFG